jgi:ABC-type Fe3+-hydroxamate transport system substrate-binding protein
VLVVGRGGAPQRESETILRELKFAVAPATEMAEALRVLEGLHPDLIVAQREDASQLRASESVDVPVVEYDGGPRGIDDLIERIRLAIRKRR